MKNTKKLMLLSFMMLPLVGQTDTYKQDLRDYINDPVMPLQKDVLEASFVAGIGLPVLISKEILTKLVCNPFEFDDQAKEITCWLLTIPLVGYSAKYSFAGGAVLGYTLNSTTNYIKQEFHDDNMRAMMKNSSRTNEESQKIRQYMEDLRLQDQEAF